MDEKTARLLSALTTDFYVQTSDSFSASRQSAWPGWKRVLAWSPPGEQVLSVYDLACGNLRFERFLLGEGRDVHAWAVDGNKRLMGFGADLLAAGEGRCVVHAMHVDIMSALFAGGDRALAESVPPCDMAVSFGFLHHVPLPEQRVRVLRALVDRTRPGGIVALSFWQFEMSPRIMAKACTVAGGAEGDYLLGWQDRTDVARYCHSYAEEEIDELAASVGDNAREVDRFSSDGRSQDLNRYLVLRRT